MLDRLIHRVEQLEKTIFERDSECADFEKLARLERIIMAALDTLKSIADSMQPGPSALTAAIAAKEATVNALTAELATANAKIAADETATQAIADSLAATKAAYDALLASQSA